MCREVAPEEKFEIRTPTAIAGPRGTGWIMGFIDDSTYVTCFEGKVYVIGLDEQGNTISKKDITEGFVNIPEEWLEAHSLSLDSNNVTLDVLKTRPIRAWVKSQVEQARAYFREGKAYLDSLPVLRCKIAGYWYCARFECVLDAIEHDGFVLRGAYRERKRFVHQLKLTWLTLSVAIQHLFRPVLSQTEVITHGSALDFPDIWTQKNAIYDRQEPGISSAVAVNKNDQI